MQGTNSIRAIKDKAETKVLRDELATFFKTFQTRIVLTAHPTQFYPGPVLGIINDLIAAFKLDDLTEIKKLMAQLGKTPFINKQKQLYVLDIRIEKFTGRMWIKFTIVYDHNLQKNKDDNIHKSEALKR